MLKIILLAKENKKNRNSISVWYLLTINITHQALDLFLSCSSYSKHSFISPPFVLLVLVYFVTVHSVIYLSSPGFTVLQHYLYFFLLFDIPSFLSYSSLESFLCGQNDFFSYCSTLLSCDHLWLHHLLSGSLFPLYSPTHFLWDLVP